MADTERGQAARQPKTAGPNRREELDAILQRIAEHIAEVDRQQAGADGKSPPSGAVPKASDNGPSPGPVAAPSGKLTLTAGDAVAPVASTRPAEPTAERPAPSATPNREKPIASRPNASSASADEPTMNEAVPDDGFGLSDVLPYQSASPRARATASEPPALRSALKNQAPPVAVRRVSLREAAAPVTLPTLAPHQEGDAADPWDSQAAEALSRAYDDLEAVAPPAPSRADVMTSPSRHDVVRPETLSGPLFASASLSGPAGSMGASELNVGEAQLARMAERVEAALDRLAPREMVAALDRRFDGLERHIASTHDQSARLEGIETRLGELGAKLSEDNVVALFGGLVPTAEDLTQFADEAASKAADRVLEAYAQELLSAPASAPAKNGDVSQEIKSLRELIATFMDDRRRNDAGTQEALETLQLAMQHVLDRIDPADEAPTATAAQPAPAMSAPAMDGASPQGRQQNTGPGQHDLSHDLGHLEYDPETDRLDPRLPQDLDSVPHAPHYTEAAPAGAAFARGLAASHLPPQHAPPGHSAHFEAAEPPQAPAMSDRQAFIAHARKAAEKAKAEAESKAAAEQPAGKTRGLRAQMMAGVPTKAIGGIRPSVLIVTTLAALLLAGYWFVAGARIRMPGAQPTVAQQELPADAGRGQQPATSGQPDIETNGSTPAGQLPGKPDKTSDEQVIERTPAPLEEARANDLPVEPGSLGIALAQSETPPTIDAVMRARNQQQLANLSHRTSFNAAEQLAARATSAMSENEPAEATPPVAAVPQAGARSDNAQLELPPALIGPLSLRLAAAKGDASAQLEVATRYAEGRGVKQSFTDAVVWYQRAAMQGLAVAQYRLATLQERGMGVKADPARARVWYQRAAEQGNLKAMHNLAVMSASPANGTPDYDTAARLFTDAAERGLADSQYNLAILAESGLGMQKDLVAAYKWYTLAAKAGDQDAARRRDQLIPRLTQDMIRTSEKRVSAWRPQTGNAFANDARIAAEAWKQPVAAKAR